MISPLENTKIQHATCMQREDYRCRHQIRLGKISMDSIREELLDFFTENPLPSDEVHDYTICSDKEILDRLDIDLGGII